MWAPGAAPAAAGAGGATRRLLFFFNSGHNTVNGHILSMTHYRGANASPFGQKAMHVSDYTRWR